LVLIFILPQTHGMKKANQQMSKSNLGNHFSFLVIAKI
jgi:hypothetical protein